MKKITQETIYLAMALQPMVAWECWGLEDSARLAQIGWCKMQVCSRITWPISRPRTILTEPIKNNEQILDYTQYKWTRATDQCRHGKVC